MLSRVIIRRHGLNTLRLASTAVTFATICTPALCTPTIHTPTHNFLLHSRFYSTAQPQNALESSVPPDEKRQNNNSSRPKREPIHDFGTARERGLSALSQMGILASDPSMDATAILENLEAVLSLETSNLDSANESEYSAKRRARLLDASISLGHRLLTRLHNLNKATGNENIPDSLLFRRLLSIFISYNVLHVSHLNRVLATMLSEENYSKALAVWIESLEFFKGHPERLLDKDDAEKHYQLKAKDQFFYGGLASYLLSLSENKTQLDPEFVKLILADFGDKPSEENLGHYLRGLRLPNSQQNLARNQWRHYYNATIDYNKPSIWRGAMKAARENKGAKVERLIAHNLERAAEKNEELTTETLASIMRIYNIDKNYQKALQTWTKVTQELKLQPNVELWNQFLLANVRSNAPKKLLRIDSVWKLLKESTEANSESYRFLIEGYVSTGALTKALEVVTNLKKDNPALFTNKVKEELIVGLLENGYAEQGDQLFRTYAAEDKDNFKPSIILYNQLLHHFLKANDLKRATEIIDQLIASGKTNPQLAPDIATWTIVVDIVLKQARKVGASSDFIVDELKHILTSMSSNGIKINEEALTMLITNLSRDPETAELGWEFFQFMKSSKMRISAVAYTAVIFNECANGRMDRALELFEEGLESGIKLRPQFYNLIFKGYSDHPNVDSTVKFYHFIDAKTSNRDDQKPNFFSFYYLLREALFVEDPEFIRFVVTELNDKKLKEYGNQIPRLLTDVERRGITLPEELKNSVEESISRKKHGDIKSRVDVDYA
ncbi:hypothetical protein FOA43_004810 [Brettanomyces nanus]|uniref:Mitochondrial 15S rRNA processing factor CCM1 n=1 Tax=Eeniella nana TaxID=13502 RepID=A0A875RYN7_EENNA|nr:uncharacterized protein FOA43_004810 [Brettanomyces nanus]QPG77397.1 hypothetical protein FOA43_004810 [Brettanomyces nanus]